MVNTQLLMVAASLFLAFAPRSVVSIYSCLFLTAFARSFQGPARLAVLPHVVPPELLSKAITWNSSAQEISNVGGPALAGLLLATAGSQSVYLVQVGCALAVLFCFSRLRSYKEKDVPAAPPPPGALLDGVRFVWHTADFFGHFARSVRRPVWWRNGSIAHLCGRNFTHRSQRARMASRRAVRRGRFHGVYPFASQQNTRPGVPFCCWQSPGSARPP